MAQKKTKAKSKPRKKKMKRAKSKKSIVSLLNLKVTDQDRRALNALAERYAKGNLSAWLRFAGEEFRPSKKQRMLLESLVKTKDRVTGARAA